MVKRVEYHWTPSESKSLPTLTGVVVLWALTLAGCGGSSGNNSAPVAQDTDATNTADGSDTSGGFDTTGDTDTTGGTDTTGTDTTGDTGTTGGTDTTDPGDTGNETVGPANCPPLTGSGNVSPIAGLYDLSNDFGGGTDIIYLQISASGNLISYDYAQDDSEQGDNCYFIFSGEAALTATGGATYSSTFYDEPELNCDTVTIDGYIVTRSDSTLTIDGPDVDDEDNDGDTTDREIVTYPVLNGLSTQDFNEC